MRNAIASARKHFNLFGVNRVLARATRNGQEFQARVPGYRHTVSIRLGTTDVAAFEHVFIDDEYALPLERAPSTIVDAGANCGMSAVYFALRYPSARIYAIEPEPSNFAILKKNARAFPQITPIEAALWNCDSRLNIVDTGGGQWALRVEDRGSDGPVPSISISTLLHKYDIDYIDLLKIDIEGAEREVFSGADEWIGYVDTICAELHDRFRDGCTEAFEAAIAPFPFRWQQGELRCVSRHGSSS